MYPFYSARKILCVDAAPVRGFGSVGFCTTWNFKCDHGTSRLLPITRLPAKCFVICRGVRHAQKPTPECQLQKMFIVVLAGMTFLHADSARISGDVLTLWPINNLHHCTLPSPSFPPLLATGIRLTMMDLGGIVEDL